MLADALVSDVCRLQGRICTTQELLLYLSERRTGFDEVDGIDAGGEILELSKRLNSQTG